jgi:hypothetical protein
MERSGVARPTTRSVLGSGYLSRSIARCRRPILHFLYPDTAPWELAEQLLMHATLAPASLSFAPRGEPQTIYPLQRFEREIHLLYAAGVRADMEGSDPQSV